MVTAMPDNLIVALVRASALRAGDQLRITDTDETRRWITVSRIVIQRTGLLRVMGDGYVGTRHPHEQVLVRWQVSDMATHARQTEQP